MTARGRDPGQAAARPEAPAGDVPPADNAPDDVAPADVAPADTPPADVPPAASGGTPTRGGAPTRGAIARGWSAADALTYPLAQLLAEPPGSSRTFRIAGIVLDLGEDLRQADPVEGDVRVARTNRGVLVTGRLRTSLAEECSRCLREIEVPIDVDLDEEVLPSVDIATGLAIDPSAEPDVARLTGSHELELEPLVREAILLAEPIAPLCREDCPGLCPVCGLELASGPHQHDEDDVDPRLEALRRFRVDGEPDTG